MIRVAPLGRSWDVHRRQGRKPELLIYLYRPIRTTFPSFAVPGMRLALVGEDDKRADMQSRKIIHLVGCHAAGEVGDVIVGGVLPPAGASMYDRMRAMERDHDDIRRLLLLEPRGKVTRSVILLTPPIRPDCDAGLIIMESTEYVPMSGSNSICAVTVLLETGILPMREPETSLMLDTAAGPVAIKARCRNGKVEAVTLTNVPAFVDRLDAPLEVPGHGTILTDVAYGGMFYASVDARALGFEVAPHEARDLAQLGESIRLAAREQFAVAHPENPGINGVTIVQFAGPFAGPGQATRNTCIMSPGRSDRSPTGTGTSARMAILAARGQLKRGESLVHQSIIGSEFVGHWIADTTVGGKPAIISTISGEGWITGTSQVFVDPTDPFPEGYVVADSWGVTGNVTQEQRPGAVG
jgi:trans-L-3-hydroxyproline dehydratase